MNPAIIFVAVIVFSVTTITWVALLEREVRKERAAITDLIRGYKPLSPNPDVVYTKKALLAAIEKRSHRERRAKN